MKFKKYITLVVVALMIFSAFSVAAAPTGYVTNGLVGLFQGNLNQGTSHNKQTTTWKDLSGKNNNFTVITDSQNYWTDNGYFVDSTKVHLPDVFVDLVNSNEFTTELVLNNFASLTTAWNPLLNCDNDSTQYSEMLQTTPFSLRINTAFPR